ncbi:hypothetical protein V6R21_07725 [Limibacter armeniacum]|uniref:hypothetical protein n=1 Tax=Limibacter armeniacum TaxID=466084 RepID=UPI002FE61669
MSKIKRSGRHAYMAEVGTLVTLPSAAVPDEPKKYIPKVERDEDSQFTNISPWGEDNLFPQMIEGKIRANTILSSTLDFMGRLLYGGGITYGKIEGYDAEGKEIFSPVDKIEDIEKLLRRMRYSNYLPYSCSSFYRFYNIFPSVVLNKDRSKVINIIPNKTGFCRWGKQNNKGIIDKCYINSDWEKKTEAEAKAIPVIDKWMDPVEFVKEGKDPEYIYPITYPSENFFYAQAPWLAGIESGWYDVAQAIPEFKKMMFQNQVTIKYHIQIHEKWWEWRWPGFSTKPQEERDAIVAEVLESFEEKMKGNENAGSVLMSTDFMDPATGKTVEGWKIIAIDDKLKNGTYIEDGKEANQNLLYALGIDSALVGAAPGNMNSSGSGTDKEAAIRIYLKSQQLAQDIVLEVVKFAFDFNGHQDIVPRFKHTISTTVNKGKEVEHDIN